MAASDQTTRPAEVHSKTGGNAEKSVRDWGEKIFALMDAGGPPSLFSRKGFYGTLMEWAMRDEHFKTQLFRFVDVLPMRSEEHTSELQSLTNLVCRLLLEKKKWNQVAPTR